MKTITLTPKRTETFWSRVDKSGDCWIWTRMKTRDGYGRFNFNGTLGYAHRISFSLANGGIPDGHHVDHMCHNPACVNPAHLRAATNKQNMEHREGATAANKSSGVRGVSWHKHVGKWRAMVRHNGKDINLGYFTTIPEADAVVTAKRNELFTHNLLDRIPA